ncbi:MAG: FAD-dependent oxidoreductase [Actinomycetota bacterium]
MAYVITQNCCKDASCVPVCPVDCIRPAGDKGGSTTEMLYIDPETCIDCGACMDACPVDAIHYEDDLPDSQARFRDINAEYFVRHPLQTQKYPALVKHGKIEPGALRVAIVGAGPAACYAADALIDIDGVEVSMFEKLPTPFGLVRAGVAPDHQRTKSVVSVFERAMTSKRLAAYFNVEVGRDVHHEDLLRHHHAVIYAVGMSHTRDLGIAGEQLPGSHAASDFVAWYNGHPDHRAHRFDLNGPRAVIVGNGNVALDVARVLLADNHQLVATDIADDALNSLRDSAIEEVVILGRRGVRDAAFSVGEFLALGHLSGVDIVVEGDDDLDASPDDDLETALKLELAREYIDRPRTDGHRRVVFRFRTRPVEIVGEDHVSGVALVGTVGAVAADEDIEIMPTSLVLRSIGYRGAAIADVPFSPASGTVPNQGGRVVDEEGESLAGVYVTGWIKRGPKGVIGTNRGCAEETVSAVLADFDAGLLNQPIGSREEFDAAIADRGVAHVDWSGWRAIDTSERAAGAEHSRPRIKLVDRASMLAAAKPSANPQL